MVQSDALSRHPDLCPAEDHDNKDKTILPDDLFVNSMNFDPDNTVKIVLPECLFVNAIDLDLRDLISTISDKDIIVKAAIDAFHLKAPFPLNSTASDWHIDNDRLVFYKEQCYVPDNLDLR